MGGSTVGGIVGVPTGSTIGVFNKCAINLFRTSVESVIVVGKFLRAASLWQVPDILEYQLFFAMKDLSNIDSPLKQFGNLSLY